MPSSVLFPEPLWPRMTTSSHECTQRFAQDLVVERPVQPPHPKPHQESQPRLHAGCCPLECLPLGPASSAQRDTIAASSFIQRTHAVVPLGVSLTKLDHYGLANLAGREQRQTIPILDSIFGSENDTACSAAKILPIVRQQLQDVLEAGFTPLVGRAAEQDQASITG